MKLPLAVVLCLGMWIGLVRADDGPAETPQAEPETQAEPAEEPAPTEPAEDAEPTDPAEPPQPEATSEAEPDASPPDQPELTTLIKRISYVFGINIGRSIKTDAVEIDLELLARGIRDAVEGQRALLTDEEIAKTMQEFSQFREERARETSAKNEREGAAFLAQNKKKKGVKTLPSGLQYKVLQSGRGKSPKANDTVTTHYRGTLLDGTEFDSSYSRREPTSFRVREVIPGWSEALELMKVGDKWRLFVPAKLAYGRQGFAPAIGPNATLIFEIELLAIEPPLDLKP